VEDGLARAFAVVDDEPIALEAAGPRDPGGGEHDAADESVVGSVGHRGHVPLRHDQNVCRRPWGDVFECERRVVFVDPPGRDRARDDSAEQALAHRTLSILAPSAFSFSSIRS
jgi:hypothetical protein